MPQFCEPEYLRKVNDKYKCQAKGSKSHKFIFTWKVDLNSSTKYVEGASDLHQTDGSLRLQNVQTSSSITLFFDPYQNAKLMLVDALSCIKG